MSKNEVTLKITCSMQEFKQILKDKGFKFIEDFLLDDTYFIPNSINLKEMSIREILNNAVILRDVVGYTEKYQSIKLVKKHKEFDSNGNIIKQSKKECDIKDIEQGREFLKDLGYKELMRIIENGSIFLKDDFEIETKDIQNGDKLIEIEFKKKDDTTKVYTETRNVENKPTEIEISKTTITGDKELEGAKLSVIDEEGNVIDEWISTKDTHKIEGLLIDKTYTLREEIAPDGYVKATDITFTIKNTGDVQKVTMIDKIVTMSKVDVGGNEIEGAKIQVLDKDGNIVDEWTSEKEEHIIKNLIENETYILHEEVSVGEYVKATDVTFKVTEDKETQHEKLIDKLVEVTKTDLTTGEENEYAKSTRISKIEYLRTFFDYLFRIQHTLFQEPLKKIKRERFKRNKLPNYLSLKEAKALLNAYENDNDPIRIRDSAIIHILLNCGLRVSEVSSLKISDINFENDTFRIIGKGNKERVGYINEITKKALLKYLEIRNSIVTDKKNKDYLFLSHCYKKIDTDGIRKALKRAYDYVGLDSNKYSAHTLRHTCATILYRAGFDIRLIQELLGHVQIDTTEIYTHLYDKEVMNAIAEHPLAKFMMRNAQNYAIVS